MSEAPRRVKDALIPEGWPHKGAISFKDYTMRYRANTPIVLDGLQLNIQPREKLGIVGRTGSGKTSVQLIVRVELVCTMCLCLLLVANCISQIRPQFRPPTHCHNVNMKHHSEHCHCDIQWHLESIQTTFCYITTLF